MDRKMEILEITGELVQKKGLDSFSYKDLSDRLGIAKASIHHHFSKKEDLLIAYLKMMYEQFRIVSSEVLSTGDTPWDQLNAYFEKTPVFLEWRGS